MGLLDFLFGNKDKKKERELERAANERAVNKLGDYEVILQSREAAALQVCKIIYDYVTPGDLKAAKALADSAPCSIKKNVSQEGAEVLKRELEKVGAIVTIKQVE